MNNKVILEEALEEGTATNRDYLLQDDEEQKLERLQLINVSARYQLIEVNQQLIDFHLNKVMKYQSKKQKKKTPAVVNDNIVESVEEGNEKIADTARIVQKAM